MKKLLIFVFLLALIAGCSKCILIRSEYYDITGSALMPKAADTEINIYEAGQEVKRPYSQVGAIKVMAPYGTTREAIKRELIKRAREAGADAVVDVEYVEDKENKLALCGKLFATKRNVTSTGKAVIFADKEK
ncbi:MAG TPA: hypothetical protein PLU24_05060 [Candidatus Omnitrophota bacterium]|nr:hypothetical protein [Candidatus Omnitrophota bacterium]